MIRGVDHVVILVNDLEAAIADYSALGFTVVPGGEHADGATHNALVVFPEPTQRYSSYLELIAFKRPAPDHRWWHYTTVGEGLIDFALLPDAIDEDIAAAKRRGLTLQGPIPGGRVRPDGQQIAWQLGLAFTRDLPFLCADVTPRSLRVPDGPAARHENGVIGIAGITIAVRDIHVSIERYQALLGIASSPISVRSVPDARLSGFQLGSTTITLAEPNPDANSPLRDYIVKHGEGPYALALRVAPGTDASMLDLSRVHGVRLELVNPR